MANRFKMPSPALVVAVVALFVALGGTGYAALQIPKKSVGSAQLKQNAVTSKKIKKGAVIRSKLANRAVGTGQLGNDSVTGAKLDESSLGTVPRATDATNATNATTATNATNAANATTVGGLAVRRFNYNVLTDGAATSVLSVAGYTLTASCTAGDLALTITGPGAPVTSELNGAAFDVAGVAVTNDVQATFQDGTVNLLPDDDDDVVGHAEVINTAEASGLPSLTLTYAADEFPGGRCVATGQVIAG